MLPGTYIPIVGKRAPSLRVVDTRDEPTGGGTSYTFVGVNFGPPFPGRVLLAVIGLKRVVANVINQISCTIGGVAATGEDDGTFGSGRSCGVGLWGAAVPSGSSGDVFVDWTGLGSDDQGLIMVAANGLALPAADDQGSTATNPGNFINGNIDIPAASTLVSAHAHFNANPTSFDTPPAKRHEITWGGDATLAVGWNIGMPAAVGQVVQFSWTGSVNRGLRNQTFNFG